MAKAMELLEALYRGATGYLNLSAFHPAKKNSKGSKLIHSQGYTLAGNFALSGAEAFGRGRCAEWDVYFEVCPKDRPAKGGQRGSYDTAACLPAVWMDIDFQGAGHKCQNLPPDADSALEMLRRFPLVPSALVNSGGGIHAYWFLTEPFVISSLESREFARDLSKDFKRAVTSPEFNPQGWVLDSCQDLARFLRLPDTLNHKSKPPKPVRLIHFNPATRYSVEQIQAVIPPAPVPAPRRSRVANQRAVTKKGRPRPGERLALWVASLKPLSEGEDGGRNSALNRHMKDIYRGWGYEVDGIDSSEYLRDWNARCTPPQCEADFLKTCASARKAIEREGGPTYASLNEERPFKDADQRGEIIKTEEKSMSPKIDNAGKREREKVVLSGVSGEKAERVLSAAQGLNNPLRLFVWSPSSTIAFLREAPGSEPFRECSDPDSLAHALESKLGMSFYSRDAEGNERPCDLTPPVLRRILSMPPEDTGLPVIREFVEHPVLADDGTIISSPGLHTSGAFYRKTVDVDIPTGAPTKEQVAAAVTQLEYIYSDFPFERTEDKQAAFAHLFSTFVADNMRPQPLFHYSASMPGSGKGLAATVPGYIANGRPPGLMPIDTSEKDGEIRKKIMSMLDSGKGRSFILDNVKGHLSSPALEAYLTAVEWRDRLMGGNKMGCWPANVTLTMTANNLSLSKDLERRQILIRLTPDTDEPERRSDFEIPNLVQYLIDHRGKLLSAIFTVIRHWASLGFPKSQRRLGSFEKWSTNIGGLLESCGIGSDFLATDRAPIEQEDPWKIFVQLWHESVQCCTQQPASELVRFVEKSGLILSDGSPAHSLGRKLARQQGRVFRVTYRDGSKLVRLVPQYSGRNTTWSLVDVPPKNHSLERNPGNPENPAEPYGKGILPFSKPRQNPVENTTKSRPWLSEMDGLAIEGVL